MARLLRTEWLIVPEGRQQTANTTAAAAGLVVVFTSTQRPSMPLNIRSDAVNELAERLAVRQHVSKTEAVRMALENELRRLDEALPLRERLRPLQQRVLSRPETGLKADKAFYDAISGDA